jgi:hypothetical protein
MSSASVISNMFRFVFGSSEKKTKTNVDTPNVEKQNDFVKNKNLLKLFQNSHPLTKSMENYATLASEESMLYTVKLIAQIRMQNRDAGIRLLHWLQEFHEEHLIANMSLFLEKYGRFDDFVLLPSKSKAMHVYLSLLGDKLKEDYEKMVNGLPVSSAAKWIPSETSSVNKKTALTYRLSKSMRVSISILRKKYLSPLRQYILKGNLSSSSAPVSYIDLVGDHVLGLHDNVEGIDSLLTNFVSCKNVAVICDNSASMAGLPMVAAFTLALMSARVNKTNKVLTFESSPKLVELKGLSLFENIQELRSMPNENSVNVSAALQTLLNAAVNGFDEMPDRLVIATDMSLSRADSVLNKDVLESVKQKFGKWSLPEIYLWNIGGRSPAFVSSTSMESVFTISGYSEEVFECLFCDEEPVTSSTLMMRLLNKDLFKEIVV